MYESPLPGGSVDALASAVARTIHLLSPNVDRLASAVAQRLVSPSLSSPAALDRLASAVARRLGRAVASPVRASFPGRLASEVVFPVGASPTRFASPQPRVASPSFAALASEVANRVASAIPNVSHRRRVASKAVEVEAVASRVAEHLASAQGRILASPQQAVDYLASSIARRLASPRLAASPAAAQRLASRVASAVTRTLASPQGVPQTEVGADEVLGEEKRESGRPRRKRKPD